MFLFTEWYSGVCRDENQATVLVLLGSDTFHGCHELEMWKHENQMTKQMPACTCSRCSTTKSKESENISIYSGVSEDVILLTPASRYDGKIPSPSVSTDAVVMLQPDAGLSGRKALTDSCSGHIGPQRLLACTGALVASRRQRSAPESS